MKLKFFKLASKLCKTSNHHRYKMAAVIVDKDQIVSVGINKIQSHPRSNHPYKMLHCELSAIFNAKFKDIKGCDIYVYRENTNGKSGTATPCPTCEAALREAGIKNVYYTLDGAYGKEKY